MATEARRRPACSSGGAERAACRHGTAGGTKPARLTLPRPAIIRRAPDAAGVWVEQGPSRRVLQSWARPPSSRHRCCRPLADFGIAAGRRWVVLRCSGPLLVAALLPGPAHGYIGDLMEAVNPLHRLAAEVQGPRRRAAALRRRSSAARPFAPHSSCCLPPAAPRSRPLQQAAAAAAARQQQQP